MASEDELPNDGEQTLFQEIKSSIKGVAMGAAVLVEKAKADEKRTQEGAKEPEPVRTQHHFQGDGVHFSYTVTTGMMPLRGEKGEKEADIFFVAYTRDDETERAKRPLMFSFNGGPGSASVWLHLGALGPKRVKMLDDGNLPAPPYQLVDNPESWLEHTDLIFIDPVGTGYSRPAKPELGKKFWGVKGDIESIGEFIRLYLTRNSRWTSPLFLVGESYGTTRAAGLSDHLLNHGIALNGILLVSSILNFQTAYFHKGNDLPYILFLPTYTATAWYHRRLVPELQKSLTDTLAEAERWAETEYAAALMRGDALTAEERAEVVAKLARYTGLEPRYLEDCNLRVEIFRFCKELLRAQRRTVGRLDSRIKGLDALASSETPDFDPSMTAIRPPYTALFNDYVRTALKYETDEEYLILGGGIKNPWDWNIDRMGYADTSEALRAAFAKNPYMKVFVASGYYDLATPYFATEYTLAHMGLDPSLRDNIKTGEYEAGHMMYIHTDSLTKLKKDISAFLDFALQPEERIV
ncbi:MAG: Carboxypeptidase-related protein [Chthonomonadales bacterium]|nr:Carboxypeptidase-related protein [Chthonomonadales bacterium]